MRAPAITGATNLLAILGDPIAHASSPALANERLEARGLDVRLVPWHVGASDLPRAVDALRAIRNLRGAIVTMPHKIAVMPHLDRVLSVAASVGAVNVVRRTADGRLEGSNLDGEGFASGLLAAGHTIAGRRVHLAGAGGAAVAIAFALAQRAVASISITTAPQRRPSRWPRGCDRRFPPCRSTCGLRRMRATRISSSMRLRWECVQAMRCPST